jgi:hypothetical protein
MGLTLRSGSTHMAGGIATVGVYVPFPSPYHKKHCASPTRGRDRNIWSTADAVFARMNR